jgi:hypothetical protein
MSRDVVDMGGFGMICCVVGGGVKGFVLCFIFLQFGKNFRSS